MRLLNTETYELKEFFEVRIPPYAILSHRWGDDEVSFKEYRKGAKTTGTGYRKIIDACAFVKERGHRWIWIDTCCIDKRSSAELSEAINSMYKWYRGARECIVYLADVRDHDQLPESDWFSRGWTLQELLAPQDCTFCDSKWRVIGNRNELSHTLQHITGIDARYLTTTTKWGYKSPRSASVATRMSWASRRWTTRPEDLAYSLLGLFKVNMSLLYGEGGIKAFIRLQLEIIKKSEDESIFAWNRATDAVPIDKWGFGGMLAPFPSCFAGLPDFVSLSNFKDNCGEDSLCDRLPPYTMTPRGLHLKRDLRRVREPGSEDTHAYVFHLQCSPTTAESSANGYPPTPIFLALFSDGVFYRLGDDALRNHLARMVSVPVSKGLTEFYVRQAGL